MSNVNKDTKAPLAHEQLAEGELAQDQLDEVVGGAVDNYITFPTNSSGKGTTEVGGFNWGATNPNNKP